ncbi:hypothetical protein BVG19_g4066 [[Candida] boidinii]|nr:hypothetical protein BVG19_g4066 [[Candida] boidinii]OWB52953.1 hypothetical protein B5S27_g4538 [[Candida] boidinii]OWB68821.1 hypothetical protein B5S30_g4211 [[Candida] boidinii]OWB85012.1 hypothetical protein B5S33_g3669 [[Candida] boidinii]
MIPNIKQIFASFRTEEDEMMFSRRAFYNFIGFLASCVVFSFIAQRLDSNSDLNHYNNHIIHLVKYSSGN